MHVLDLPRFGGNTLVSGLAYNYLAFMVRGKDASECRVVRATRSVCSHSDIVQAFKMESSDFETECLGGGSLSVQPYKSNILFVFVGGPDVEADRDPEMTAATLRREFPQLSISVVR